MASRPPKSSHPSKAALLKQKLRAEILVELKASKEARRLVQAKDTRIMRLATESYDYYSKLKLVYQRKHKLKRVTYSEFMDQILVVAEAMLQGAEIYKVKHKLFYDIAEARGVAIVDAVKAGEPPEPPEVLLRLGRDTSFKFGQHG